MNDSMVINCAQCGTPVRLGYQCGVCGAFAVMASPALTPSQPMPMTSPTRGWAPEPRQLAAWERLAPSTELYFAALAPVLAVVTIFAFGLYFDNYTGKVRTSDIVWPLTVAMIITVIVIMSRDKRSKAAAWAAAMIISVPTLCVWWTEKISSALLGDSSRLQPIQVSETAGWFNKSSDSSFLQFDDFALTWVLYIALSLLIGLLLGAVAWRISKMPIAIPIGIAAASITVVSTSSAAIALGVAGSGAGPMLQVVSMAYFKDISRVFVITLATLGSTMLVAVMVVTARRYLVERPPFADASPSGNSPGHPGPGSPAMAGNQIFPVASQPWASPTGQHPYAQAEPHPYTTAAPGPPNSADSRCTGAQRSGGPYQQAADREPNRPDHG